MMANYSLSSLKILSICSPKSQIEKKVLGLAISYLYIFEFYIQ